MTTNRFVLPADDRERQRIRALAIKVRAQRAVKQAEEMARFSLPMARRLSPFKTQAELDADLQHQIRRGQGGMSPFQALGNIGVAYAGEALGLAQKAIPGQQGYERRLAEAEARGENRNTAVAREYGAFEGARVNVPVGQTMSLIGSGRFQPIPLPGGKSLGDVSLGTKGAFEQALDPFAAGGVARAPLTKSAVSAVGRGSAKAASKAPAAALRFAAEETGAIRGEPAKALREVDSEIKKLSVALKATKSARAPTGEIESTLETMRQTRRDMLESILEPEDFQRMAQLEEEIPNARAYLKANQEATGPKAPKYGTPERAEYDNKRRLASEQGIPALNKAKRVKQATTRLRVLEDEYREITALELEEVPITIAPRTALQSGLGIGERQQMEMFAEFQGRGTKGQLADTEALAAREASRPLPGQTDFLNQARPEGRIERQAESQQPPAAESAATIPSASKVSLAPEQPKVSTTPTTPQQPTTPPALPAQAAQQPPALPPQGLPPPGAGGVPPASGAVPPSGGDPVKKLTGLIKAAKPARKETEALKHQELQKRAAILARTQQSSEGREGLLRSQGVLKGELPTADFDPPLANLSDPEWDGLFNQIRDFAKWERKPFQKVSTANALEKVRNGQIPTIGDIANLEEVFGEEFAKSLLGKRPWTDKLLDEILAAANLPRAIKAAFDLSGSLRQGSWFSTSRPASFGKAFVAQLKSLKSDKVAQALYDALQTSPRAGQHETANLYIAPLDGKLVKGEEAFVSKYFRFLEQKGGIFTAPLRMGQRAYVTMLNELRANVFDEIISAWEREGKVIGDQDLRELGRYINVATGRGTLPRIAGPRATAVMNSFFFSPRFVESRFEIARMLMSPSAKVRREAWHDFARYASPRLALAGLLTASGVAAFEIDPRSSDFGKMKFGNVRIDPWGGWQPLVRYIAQFTTNQRKDLETGKVKDIKGNWLEGAQYTAGRFVRSKLSPVFGVLADIAAQKTFIGEDLTVLGETQQLIGPLLASDIMDAVQQVGWMWGLPLGALAGLGAGVQSFDATEKTNKARSPGPGLPGVKPVQVKPLKVAPKAIVPSGTLTPEMRKRIRELKAQRTPVPVGAP